MLRRRPGFQVNSRGITGYLFAGLLGLVFLLLFNIRFGLTFLIVWGIAPIISFAAVEYTAGQITLQVSISSSILNKGEKTKMLIDLQSNSIIPTPFLEINLINSNNFTSQDDDVFVVSIARSTNKSISKEYTATRWGTVNLGIESINAIDFLGLIKRQLEITDLSKRIEILPSIPDINENQLLRQSIDAGLSNDDEEENHHMTESMLFGGTLGYDHREYTPGDSLKRINWRLSAKQNQYMVRLDEGRSASKQLIVLDPCNTMDSEIQTEQNERLIEAMLGMLRLTIRQGVPCSVYYYSDKAWQQRTIETNKDLSELQHKMVSIVFGNYTDYKSILLKTENISDTITVYTNNLNQIELFLNTQTTYVTTADINHFSGNFWHVSESFELYNRAGW